MKKEKFNILGIESSCDDTSAAIISENGLRSNVISSQKVHADYGGVVPELASREHIQHIVPVVDQALEKAQCSREDLTAIAVTAGPGLMGSLLVGVSFAKAMALSLDIPLIEVHHMHAHILSHFIEKPMPTFPYLCLTISGGHTQVVKVDSPRKMKILGTTLDDAAGEAFDKAGKMCGLSYPSGPIIDKYAAEGKNIYDFPIPDVPDLDFSFSGLKTAILRFLQKKTQEEDDFIENNIRDISASIQSTIIEILLQKLTSAAEKTGIKEIAIAGGVSANSGLRKAIKSLADEKNWNIYIPKIEYCTDNAAMIAQAAIYKLMDKDYAQQSLEANPRLDFSI